MIRIKYQTQKQLNRNKTQKQLIKYHLEYIGAIDSDEARELYSIVEVPKIICDLGKTKKIIHEEVMRPNKGTGKIRPIMRYRLDKSGAE